MRKIGLFEAKAKLSELCLRVEEGRETYLITRRGQPVAQLVPATGSGASKGKGILKEMESFRKKHGVPGKAQDDFPEVWLERSTSRTAPFDEA